MHWILSAQLFFGIVFARRTLQRLHEKNLIDQQRLRIAGVSVFVFLFFVAVVAKSTPLLQAAATIVFFAALASADPFFRWRLKLRIQSEFPGFINGVILGMKSGLGFRASAEHQLRQTSQLWEKWLQSALEARVFLRVTGSETASADVEWWREHLDELTHIQQNPHHALARLESLRRKIRISSEFRRKSGQALLQARIQIVVMAVLYIALLVMTMTQFRFSIHRRLILTSIALFTAGQVVFWRIARKRRWKV